MKKIKIILSYALISYVISITSAFAINEMNKYSLQENITVKQHDQILKKAETYLNSLTTIVADFTQVAPSGQISNGKFFLSRPGKLRIQYNPPVPIVLTINNSLLAYYDYELDQLSHSTASDSIASFLTRPTISFFSSDVVVKMVEKSKGVVRIRLTKTSKNKDGELILMFTEYPFELRKFAIIDNEGNITNVTLSNAKLGTKLDNRLFVLTKKSNLR